VLFSSDSSWFQRFLAPLVSRFCGISAPRPPWLPGCSVPLAPPAFQLFRFSGSFGFWQPGSLESTALRLPLFPQLIRLPRFRGSPLSRLLGSLGSRLLGSPLSRLIGFFYSLSSFGFPAPWLPRFSAPRHSGSLGFPVPGSPAFSVPLAPSAPSVPQLLRLPGSFGSPVLSAPSALRLPAL